LLELLEGLSLDLPSKFGTAVIRAIEVHTLTLTIN